MNSLASTTTAGRTRFTMDDLQDTRVFQGFLAVPGSIVNLEVDLKSVMTSTNVSGLTSAPQKKERRALPQSEAKSASLILQTLVMRGTDTRGADGVCADIDECADGTDTCVAGETCINNDGSFDCDPDTCPPFTREEGGACVDINECNIGTDGCQLSEPSYGPTTCHNYECTVRLDLCATEGFECTSGCGAGEH